MNFRFLCIAAAIGLALSNTPVFSQTSADPAAKPRTAQQNRMASCNAQAGERSFKGDARKQFMSGCLKG